MKIKKKPKKKASTRLVAASTPASTPLPSAPMTLDVPLSSLALTGGELGQADYLRDMLNRYGISDKTDSGAYAAFMGNPCKYNPSMIGLPACRGQRVVWYDPVAKQSKYVDKNPETGQTNFDPIIAPQVPAEEKKTDDPNSSKEACIAAGGRWNSYGGGCAFNSNPFKSSAPRSSYLSAPSDGQTNKMPGGKVGGGGMQSLATKESQPVGGYA